MFRSFIIFLSSYGKFALLINRLRKRAAEVSYHRRFSVLYTKEAFFLSLSALCALHIEVYGVAIGGRGTALIFLEYAVEIRH